MRTQLMMKKLCEHLSQKAKYRDIMTEGYIMELTTTTPLHDIGKVGVPDSILLKPGKLTPEEYEEMKKHVGYGVTALKSNLDPTAETPSFINTALEIINYHHEKYDGSGYPNKTKGKEIPLPGRLMAIIDVYDALISKRVYKEAFSFEEANAIIRKDTGSHFDPDIAEAFLEITSEIEKIVLPYMN
ncbi:MAG TPA: HD domain-containing phosphohydrolase [Bacillota bacterium]|nr:HD domain-containing phosphohydrolase [Bacillota bacterium]HPJ85844.1 HD domain-containing phosphohydrolase [Bacillota bacterium]HPQ62144.1 HD domain-containing phosphohydrolase [Bacillota bacterium]HRX91650.1 HD domain-containing phosphohydrolase [Candidatus Izemoplasmatales bacterium]